MNENLKDFGESLELSLAKDNLTEIVSELSDYSWENLLNLGENIPVISYLVKGIKTTFLIRDAFFMEKVILFLKTVGKMPNQEREKMIAKIQSDKKYQQKFGKFSIKALERYDDEQKAKYLGIAAQYLSRDEITFEFYQRFSHIIDSLTIPDLQEFTIDSFLNFNRNTFYSFESLGLLTTTMRLMNENDKKQAFKQDPLIVRVSHRRFTNWGEAVKNIMLQLPITSKV